MTYLDTAILVKLYTREEDSDYWRAAIGDRSSLVSSVLARLEFRCALRQKVGLKLLRANVSAKILKMFEDDLEQGIIQTLPLGADVLFASIKVIDHLPSKIQLRTLDALHLATVMQLKNATLGTTDSRMLAAANALGLKTI